MSTDEQIRGVQRQTWATCAEGWDTWDAVIHDQLGPVGEAMIGALRISTNQQHLDIASGTGEPGLSIAHRAPQGRVVLTDLSPEMLAIAARRGREQRLGNVETTVCSADDLPFDDATFDSVSVRFGYMFFPDLAKATSEFVRVLKPGGRLCASVWTQPDANPWTAIAMQAIATEVALVAPAPGTPHMYRCAEPGQLAGIYRAAGLIDVGEWDVPVMLTSSSPEEYWEIVSGHVSSAVLALQSLEDDVKKRIRAVAVTNVRTYETGGLVRVPGLARCIAGRKPG